VLLQLFARDAVERSDGKLQEKWKMPLRTNGCPGHWNIMHINTSPEKKQEKRYKTRLVGGVDAQRFIARVVMHLCGGNAPET
jgi:hypothetical protein